MTTQASPVGLDTILQMIQGLSPFDKFTLLSTLAQESGLTIALSTPADQEISMQISGLDNAGMADIMNAIASTLRGQVS